MSLRSTPRFLLAVMLILFFVLVPFSAVFAATSTSSLTTLFATDNQYAGNMFNLTVLSANDVVINSFDVNINSDLHENTSVSVYYRLGGYSGYEANASAWTLVGTTSVATNGINVPTPISVGDFTLAAGQTYGIYITVDNYSMPYIRMYYTEGTTTYQDDYLKISDSIGRGTPNFSGITILERLWNGTIYYTVQPPTPTVSPVIPQTGDSSGSFLWLFGTAALLSSSIIIFLVRKHVYFHRY